MHEATGSAKHAGGELERLRRQLPDVLARPDMLRLHEVGAGLAMAVHRLEAAHLGLIHVPWTNADPPSLPVARPRIRPPACSAGSPRRS